MPKADSGKAFLVPVIGWILEGLQEAHFLVHRSYLIPSPEGCIGLVLLKQCSFHDLLLLFGKDRLVLHIQLRSLVSWFWVNLKGNLMKAMTTHSSTLAWKIPWTEEPGSCSPRGCEELDTTERVHFHFSLSCTGEGNGSPLQCSCLENPRDGGAW